MMTLRLLLVAGCVAREAWALEAIGDDDTISFGNSFPMTNYFSHVDVNSMMDGVSRSGVMDEFRPGMQMQDMSFLRTKMAPISAGSNPLFFRSDLARANYETMQRAMGPEVAIEIERAGMMKQAAEKVEAAAQAARAEAWQAAEAAKKAKAAGDASLAKAKAVKAAELAMELEAMGLETQTEEAKLEARFKAATEALKEASANRDPNTELDPNMPKFNVEQRPHPLSLDHSQMADKTWFDRKAWKHDNEWHSDPEHPDGIITKYKWNRDPESLKRMKLLAEHSPLKDGTFTGAAKALVAASVDNDLSGIHGFDLGSDFHNEFGGTSAGQGNFQDMLIHLGKNGLVLKEH